MLSLVEKGIRGGICQAIHQYLKANNKYMKYYDKYKESSYLKYWDVNNLHGRSMSQKLPVNDWKLVENNSDISELMKNIFLKLICSTQIIYITFTVIHLF